MQGCNVVKNKGMFPYLIVFILVFGLLLLTPQSIFPIELVYFLKEFFYIDDVIHILLFVAMYSLLTFTLRVKKRFIFLFACMMAVGSEAMQLFTLRTASWSDAFADLVGISLGVFMILIWERWMTHGK